MTLCAPTLLLLLLSQSTRASRCLPIPPGMALCQGLGYNIMRMPNLLGHESPGEAVQQSGSWLPLLARDCHPYARIFLCSLFAPVCLERIISPCRSLCESVQDSCAPIMNCYGYSWPRILHCDQFPKDHLMCISPVTHMSNSTSNTHSVPQASCTDCELEETTSVKVLLDLLCKSDFAVKVRLAQSNSSSSAIAKFSLGSRLDVLKHGPLLGGEMKGRLALWLERDATCVGNLNRHHPQGATFLLTGTVMGDRLLVNKAFSWSRHPRQLNQAARKWKHHRCRG
ncbi:secreted frizzled-related protein 5 isoform X2 [Brachyhypopomus gauderio]|uniref:secreted frizzled-related protein 5 isoform X2 n=1 Tax=Brachyhypopomus gauderio TaxID=698409 RepID=UPI004042B529